MFHCLCDYRKISYLDFFCLVSVVHTIKHNAQCLAEIQGPSCVSEQKMSHWLVGKQENLSNAALLSYFPIGCVNVPFRHNKKAIM